MSVTFPADRLIEHGLQSLSISFFCPFQKMPAGVFYLPAVNNFS